jgi:threonine/homoserine/homoserine lactone efflux protein
MINAELFAAFVAASVVLVLIPGPIVTLVIAHSIANGTRTGLTSVAGATLGNAVLAMGAVFGLTAVLAVMADLFDWLRWAGAAYLIYLGLRQWRDAIWAPMAVAAAGSAETPRGRSVFLQGLIVSVTNPKGLLFYGAFFPQFVDPALPVVPQFAVMGLAFVVIGLISDGGYALLAGRARNMLRGGWRARVRSGVTGTLLIGTGAAIALTRRVS